MNKFLSVIAAVAAVTWMSVAPANALTCGAGCYGVIGSPFSGGSGNGAFGDIAVTAAAFTDQFAFELQAPPSSYNSVTNSITVNNDVITGLTLSIFSCTDVTCGTSSLVASTSTTSTDGSGNQTITLAANSLGIGFYFIQVDGAGVTFANPNSKSSGYSGTIAVSGVPLPGALPLFVSGLGALGFAGLRKRKKAKLAA